MSDAYREEILKRITKDLLDIQLLRMVALQPMWGYRIKKTVEGQLGIKLRHGALYPTLNQLEKDGFVKSEKQKQKGRARKVYTATAKGKAYLQSYYAILEEQIGK